MGVRWLTAAVSIVTSWALLALVLDSWGKTREPEGVYDYVIVAGCRVDPDGTPSPALQGRVEVAVALWKMGVAPALVFTGGIGTFPPSEARAASDHAAGLGVPREVMILEDRSTSTEENAANAAITLRERDGAPPRRVLVVTDAYHVFRARRVFNRHFEHVDAVGSTYGYVSRVRGAFREVLAIGKYAAYGDL